MYKTIIMIALVFSMFLFPKLCTSNPYDITIGTPFELDSDYERTSALSKIDDIHYLCTYRVLGNAGRSVVLTVDTDTGMITKETPFDFETNYAAFPALSKIDDSHYLCVYMEDCSGSAVVLTVNSDDWSISKEIPFEFETNEIYYPAVSKIDDTHYLCAYKGPDLNNLWSVILTIDQDNWTIMNETPFEISTNIGTAGYSPALSQIDDTHYLCAYTGLNDAGWAVVLTIDTDDWTIDKETPFEFEVNFGADPDLSKIDDNHYICAYTGPNEDGWAVILTVNNYDWIITLEGRFEFDSDKGYYPALSMIDDTHYLCTYTGSDVDGWAVVLTIDIDNWTIDKETPFEFDTDNGYYPTLSKIDNEHHLCTYKGSSLYGWSVILNVELPYPVDPYILQKDTKLIGNYPNPFYHSTNICFMLPMSHEKDIEVNIYDIKGKLIKKLSLYGMNAQYQVTSIEWDGMDENGLKLPTGLYFYRLTIENYSEVKKMILIRQ